MAKKVKESLRLPSLGRRGNHLAINVSPDLNPNFYTPFVKGNTYAKTEKIGPEAHKKRMQAMFRGWATLERKRRGEKIVSVDEQKRKRTRERLDVVKEAREIQQIARGHAAQAMETLAEILENPMAQDSAKIQAATVIFDRAYGKAVQQNVNTNVDANGKPNEVSERELESRIKAALDRVERIVGGEKQAETSEERPPDICLRH